MAVSSWVAFDSKKVTKEGLRRLNLIICLLLALQAIAVLLLGDGAKAGRPVTVGHLSNDPSAGAGVMLPAVRHLFDINLVYLVVTFLAIGAVYHLLLATWRRSAYEAGLQAGRSSVRWWFYWLGFGLMLLTAQVIVGFSDVTIFLLSLGSVGLMAWSANLVETGGSRQSLGRSNYRLGLVAALLPWLATAKYIWADHFYGSGLTAYDYAAVLALLLAFVYLLLILRRSHQKTGRWRDYFFVERGYLLLNFVALSLVAWLIYGSALH